MSLATSGFAQSALAELPKEENTEESFPFVLPNVSSGEDLMENILAGAYQISEPKSEDYFRSEAEFQNVHTG